MRVMLVGEGGREAALAWRIAQSPTLRALAVTGENPGWPDGVVHHPAKSPAEIVAAAQAFGADLVVVGPEGPLEAGVVDRLAEAGIAAFGPTAAAARLETSKAFAKEILAAAGVPTAGALIIDSDDASSVARGRDRCAQGQVVVKVDGLAAGKGVIVCGTPDEAHAALDEVLGGRFGAAARRVVLEDRLTGPEVSLFGLCDGRRLVALPPAQDHKRLLDGGRGPNTGGMGAFAPSPLLDDPQGALERLGGPVIAELARRKTPFRGVLYLGLMCTPGGLRVLEFNVRFGDPECQALMCLWDEDVLPWFHGAATGALPEGRPTFRAGAACCVVLAAAGYPVRAEPGAPIPEPPSAEGVRVFLAGARRDAAGVLRASGGRVLGLTGVGADLSEARARAYGALPGWRFSGAQWRRDIGAEGLGEGDGRLAPGVGPT